MTRRIDHLTEGALAGLIFGLPAGQVAYCQGPHGWDVAIFTPGTVHRVATIAANMDKGLACWLTIKLQEARKQDVSHKPA